MCGREVATRVATARYTLPFKILGAAIQLHWSLVFLIAFVLCLNFTVLESGLSEESHGKLYTALLIIAQLVGVLICVLLHELAHAAVYRLYGAPVDQIILIALGGATVSPVEFGSGVLKSAHSQLLISAAGPLVNLILWGCALAADGAITADVNSTLFNSTTGEFLSALVTLIWIWNAILGVSNALPIFPLDGGRCLHGLCRFCLPTRQAFFCTSLVAIGGCLIIVAVDVLDAIESKFSDWLIWVDVPIIVVVTLGNVYVLCGTFDEEQVDLDTARSPDPEPLLGSIQNEGEAA